MRRIVIPGFSAPQPPIDNELVKKVVVEQKPVAKKKVKKSELKEIVGAILNEAVAPPKPKVVKKPKVEEGTVETRIKEFKRMQKEEIDCWFSARNLTYSDGLVFRFNGQVLGNYNVAPNDSMVVTLDPLCFPDMTQRKSWILGAPSVIKTRKQDRMLHSFCGTDLTWSFDRIHTKGFDPVHLGTFQRFSDGSLQINIIYGDEARRGEYKYDCFKGIGD